MKAILDAFRHGSTEVESNFGDYAEQESVFVTICTTPDYDKSIQIHFTVEQYIDFLAQMKALQDKACEVIAETTKHTAVFI